MDLTNYFKASYPVIYLWTSEEERAELAILESMKKLQGDRKILVWSHTEGLREPDQAPKTNPEKTDIVEALQAVVYGEESKESGVFIFRDVHPFLDIPIVKRLIRDAADLFKGGGKNLRRTLIFISPVNKVPPDIERDVTLLEFALPTRDDLSPIVAKVLKRKEFDEVDEDERDRIVSSCLGLTTIEAENAMAKASVQWFNEDKKNRPPISRLVMHEKALAVKKAGILDYYEASEKAEDVGGLQDLKNYLTLRVQAAYTKRAREFGLPLPKGILLVGLPGTGKSLVAKAASNVLGVPLIRFDVGKVFQGLVGSSEANMRTAIQTIDAVGNCVVFIDEMEKGLAGAGGGGDHDGGTTARVFGTFLTWMQEKKSPSFICATVNRIDRLPDELLRKGRFDEIFFVNLPTVEEREEIFCIQIRKHGREVKSINCVKLAEKARAFSGAEIEAAVVGGLYAAFHSGKDLKTEFIEDEISRITPLAKSRKDQLAAMVAWAEKNARAASEGSTDKQKLERELELTIPAGE